MPPPPTPCQKCKAERERLVQRVAELEALVARRHDSSCSREGARAVDECPECHLGFYEQGDVPYTPDTP